MLLTSRELQKVLWRFLAAVAACSVLTVVVWLKLFYQPHVRLLAWLLNSCSGWICTWTAWLAVLAESALPVALLFDRQFSRLKRRMFEMTLAMRGVELSRADEGEARELRRASRERRRRREELEQQSTAEGAGGSGASSSGRGGLLSANAIVGVFKALLFPAPQESTGIKLARACLTTPVKLLVPVTIPLWLLCEGTAEAEEHFGRYLEGKGIEDPDEQAVVAESRAGEYRSFGTMAALLSQVPLFSYLLGLSNSVGAALWAADVEKKGGSILRR